MDLDLAKPIDITDKPLFDEYILKFPPEISELSFTNIFMWRNHYNFRFFEWKDHLLLFSRNPNKIFFFPPIGPNSDEIILDLLNSIENVEIRRVPESIVDKLRNYEKSQGFSLEFIEDPNNWDYIYEKESLISLSGNKLRQKRRWLKKFVETYNFEFQLISEDNIDCCSELQIEWCDMNECRLHEDLLEEQNAIFEAIKHYHDLKYKGGIILVDGKCIAYTLGELLSPDTMVIHIEKAHRFYEGSYQAINNFFCKNSI